MKVFVGWSGERARRVAEQLREWLPKINSAFEPWVSEDIEKGMRWLDQLLTRLREGGVGVLCITSETRASAWLHFEAGALHTTTDGPSPLQKDRIFPYLLRPTTLRGSPLEHFQKTVANKRDTLLLLKTLNDAAGDRDQLSPDALTRVFEKRWDELNKTLKRIRRASISIETDAGLDTTYSDLFHSVWAQYRLENEPQGEDGQALVAKLVEDESRKRYQLKRPPPPQDPALLHMVSLYHKKLDLNCHLCGLDHRPDRNGCCGKCGLFCLFWAIDWPKDQVS